MANRAGEASKNGNATVARVDARDAPFQRIEQTIAARTQDLDARLSLLKTFQTPPNSTSTPATGGNSTAEVADAVA